MAASAVATRVQWRWKRSTGMAHAFRECGDRSLCGRMLSSNGPITQTRSHRCKFCEVDAAKLLGFADISGDQFCSDCGRNLAEVGGGSCEVCK